MEFLKKDVALWRRFSFLLTISMKGFSTLNQRKWYGGHELKKKHTRTGNQSHCCLNLKYENLIICHRADLVWINNRKWFCKISRTTMLIIYREKKNGLSWVEIPVYKETFYFRKSSFVFWELFMKHKTELNRAVRCKCIRTAHSWALVRTFAKFAVYTTT